MNIVVANLASPANPGDQAIFRGSLNLIKKNFKEAHVTVVTRAYSERAVYDELGCSVVPGYPDVEYLACESTAEKLVKLPLALLSPGKLKNAIKNCDLVFLSGGAYFYSYKSLMPGFMYMSHFTPIHFARKFNKPVVFLPQSYGPFESGFAQELFDWAMGKSQWISYREEITGDWLKERYPGFQDKCSFMPDLAFNLKREDVVLPFKKNLETGYVGVTVRAWSSGDYNQDDYLEVLLDTLVWLHQEFNYKIRVIAQVQDPKKGEGDEWISAVLVESLKQLIGVDNIDFCTKEPYFSLPEICDLYQQCEMLIGMRLHSALLSFVVGRPALVVGYQHKAEGIIKKLGLEGLYLGSFDEVGRAQFQDACRNVVRNKEIWSQKIDKALNNARNEIQATFDEGMKRVFDENFIRTSL